MSTDLKKAKLYYISPVRLFWIIFIVAALFQLIIISYNHISEIYINRSTWQFLFRWSYSTLLTMIGFALIVYPDLFLIRVLNMKVTWSQNIAKRVLIELIILVVIAFAISSVITTLSHLISPYDNGLMKNLINNGLITSVVNLVIVASLEAWIFFREGRINKEKAEELERELTGIRFEVLKNQVNPHFLFNSLNVLSGLVKKDPQKAQQFIDEFSMIYRYVLETIEKKVALLKDELEFARSYMFLQQIRYGDGLLYEVNLDSRVLDRWLPPLSLQVVLENAIKHNIIDKAHPLEISISNEDGWLLIINNMQQKMSSRNNLGIGQQNLMKRYRMIGLEEPVFQISNQSYIARLPLIEEL